MKRSSVLVLAVISLWGCNNDDQKKIPAPKANEQTQTTGIDNYAGQNLVMSFTSTENFGLIRLGGDDARALYSSLALAVTADESGFVKTKSSEKVKCDEITIAESEGTPASSSYQCFIGINYRAGTINTMNMPSVADETVAELTDNYISTNLSMTANDANHTGSIRLVSDDARALYFALSAEAVTSEDVSTKLTQDMMCAFSGSTSEYVCLVNMNFRNGQIVQNVLPAPVVEEPITETPVVEQPVAEAPSTVPAEDVITVVTF